MDRNPLDQAMNAFCRPALWLAVLILVANDHWWKHAYPSWWTGKLSDLAGVFFFPFLLIACLAALLPRGTRPDRLGALVFAVTAVWFTAIKIVPAANELTSAAIGALVGVDRVKIVRDPTDLLALFVLWPAWRLWRRSEREPAASRLRKLAGTLTLVAAAVATMATTPAHEEAVVRLAVDGRDLYSAAVEFYPDADESDIHNALLNEVRLRRYRKSDDGGMTWSEVEEDALLSTVRKHLTSPVVLPVVACNPGRQCARTGGDGRIEYIYPDYEYPDLPGEDYEWDPWWQIGDGRFRYIGRAYKSLKFLPGPFDIAWVPTGNTYELVAAMGTEGIARSMWYFDNWYQFALTPYFDRPTDVRAANPVEASRATLPELGLALLAATATLLVLSLWRRWKRDPDSPAKEQTARTLLIGTLVLATFGVIGVAVEIANYSGSHGIALAFWWLAVLMLVGASVRHLRDVTWPDGLSAIRVWMAAFAVTWLPFFLWADGMISDYRVAAALAVAALGCLWMWLVRCIVRARQAAAA